MKPICRGIGFSVVLTVLLLFPVQLQADEWDFIKSFPNPNIIKSSVHGLAVDPEGKVWVQFWNPITGDSVVEANGISTPVRAIYIYDKNGNNVSFSPIKILSGGGIHDTMFTVPAARAVTNRGMATDHQGNILVSVFDAIYRLDYKTGAVMKKVQPFPGNALTAPAVDSAGNIIVGTVVPGYPVKIFDKNFSYLRNVMEIANGYSRSMAISKDGKDVFYAGYTLHCVLRYHSANGVAGPYVLADTILKGFDCESFARHPKTNYIWASSGSGNDLPNRYPGATTNWLSHTWYAYDPEGKQVVDTLMWMYVMDLFNTRPRAIAFSSKGDTAYLGSLNASTETYSWFAPVQMFIHQGAFGMKPNIVVIDTVKFKTVPLGFPDTITISISNNGKSILTVSSMSLNNTEFGIVGSTSFMLVQGAEKKLRVVVNPISVGPKNTTLTISSNAIDSVKQVFITGAADHPSKITVTPDSFVVSINEKDFTKRTLTISNSGQGSLTWSLAGSTQSTEIQKLLSMIGPKNFAGMYSDAERHGLSDASKIKYRSEAEMITQRNINSGTLGDILIWSNASNSPYWEALTSTLVSAGFSVTRSSVRPIKPNISYAAIFMSEPDYSLSVQEIASLKNFVISGGKIIDMSDSYLSYINAFLIEFGVTRTYGGGYGPVNSTHKIFQGVGELTLDGNDWDTQLLVVSPSIPIATSSGQIIASISSNNGLLVLGEDSQFSDFNNSLSDQDNMQLLKNIISWITTGLSGWVSVNPAGGVIAPNDSQAVSITFDANDVLPGIYHETIEIVHNDPLSVIKKIPVTLNVASVPHIETPDSVVLKQTTYIGVPDTFNIVLKSTGSEHLIVFSMTSNNPEFSILGNTLFSVPSLTSRNVPVRFNPTSPGIKSAIFKITSTDPDTTTFITVVGKADYPPNMVVTPDSFTVSLKVGDSINTQINISNSSGMGPLYYRILSWDLTDAMLQIPNYSIHPKIIMHNQNNVNGWQVVEKLLNINQQLPEDVTKKTVTISNGLSPSFLPLLIKDKIGDGGVVDISEIRGSVAGGKLNIGILFAPGVNIDSAVAGIYIDIDRNPNTGERNSQYFHDLGIEYYAFYFGKKINSYDSISVNGVSGSTRYVSYQIYGQEIRYSIPLTMLNKDDGIMDIVAISGTLNMSTDTAPDTGHATILPIPLWLSVNPDSGTIAPGGNSSSTVSVNTTAMIGGEYKAQVIVSGNDPLHPFKAIPITVNLKGNPKQTVLTDTLKFGKTYINGTSTNSFTISSTGTDKLSGKILTDNPRFAIQDSGFAIPVGEKKIISVKFMPLAKGIATALLTITSNADSLPKTIVLQGEGVYPPNIKIDSISFKFAGGNRDTLTSSFTVHNTGGSDLVVNIRDEEKGIASEYIYASYSNKINKIDLTTKSVVQTLIPSFFGDTLNQNLEMACSGNELFITKYSSIYVIDSKTGATKRILNTSLSWIYGLAYLNNHLYALGYNTNQIYILDPLNGAMLDTLQTPISLYEEIDGANGRLFAIGSYSAYELNPNNGSVIRTFNLGTNEYYTGIAFTGSRLFVNNRYTNPKILELNPETGARKDSMNLIGNYYSAITGGVPADAQWLTETPSSGTIHEGDSAKFNIKILPSALAKGNYQATLIISSNDPDSAKVLIPVSFSILTGIFEDNSLPEEFTLFQNYPNPFNPSTTIAFNLPVESHVEVEIFNVIGQKVTSILDEVKQAGRYKEIWNASGYASGIYFYRIRAGNFIETKKLVLMK